MRKGNLTGWKDVFQFTIAQNIKNKTYVCSTLIVTILIAVALICLNVLPAVIKEKKEGASPKTAAIEEVVILDESGLPAIDWTQLQSLHETYKTTKFTTVSEEDGIKEQLEESEQVKVFVAIEKEEKEYRITVTTPASKKIGESDSYGLANVMREYFRTSQAENMNLSKEQIAFVDLPMDSSVQIAGEEVKEDNFLAKFVQYFINIGLFVVFIMLIEAYAKMTATIVAMEKSSKVLELILTSIRPYATMVGKIVAMVTLVTGQFLLWIVVGVVSFFGSNALLKTVNPKYNNQLLEFFDMLKQNGFSFEFHIGNILLAFCIIILGIAVYITIAAVLGACVGKIEELAQSLQSFSLLLLVGAYIPLFSNILTLKNESGSMGTLELLATNLPICSMYVVPTGLVLGTVSISTALISLAIIIATLIVLFVLVGKVYGTIILHSGSRLKIKDVIAMSKSK